MTDEQEYDQPDENQRASAREWLDRLSSWASALEPLRLRLEETVCKGGLWDRVAECPERGMRGTFGPATLCTYAMAGRIMLTIAGPGEDVDVTFLGADKRNSVGYGVPIRIGLHSVGQGSDLATIEALITAVLAGWPQDPITQQKVFGTYPTQIIS